MNTVIQKTVHAVKDLQSEGAKQIDRKKMQKYSYMKAFAESDPTA